MEHEGEAPTKPFGFVGTSPSFFDITWCSAAVVAG
jgi:hypothetical protein